MKVDSQLIIDFINQEQEEVGKKRVKCANLLGAGSNGALKNRVCMEDGKLAALEKMRVFIETLEEQHHATE